MITNTNDSKVPSSGEFINIKKYVGVGSANVIAVNPNNAQLRKWGWSIPEDAKEPEYVSTDKEGKSNTRVRFLVRLDELDNPVIPMDFFIRKDFRTSNSSGVQKAQVIDEYGRTAYVTQQEFQSKTVPQFDDGSPKISKNYRMCHIGESDLVTFIMKYLNVTPTRTWDKISQKYVQTKDPGKLVFDSWDKLCSGDMTEIRNYIAMKPDNRVKVMFGIRSNADNRSYQSFITSSYLGNGSFLDSNGEYANAKTAIEKFMKGRDPEGPVKYSYSAKPLEEWVVTATDVKDNSEDDMPDFLNEQSKFPWED